MISNRFTISTLILIVLTALDSLAFTWAIQQDAMVVTSINLGIVWIILVSYLIWYVQRINRDLTRFFQAFRFQDSSMLFNTRNGDRSFQQLYKELNQIILEYGQVKKDREQDMHFFRHILEHLRIGLIAFNESEKILLHNQALLDIFNLKRIVSLSDLVISDGHMPTILFRMKNGESRTIKVSHEFEEQQLAALASVFKLSGESIRLVSFQNIKGEMETTETEAWQKMIRVLTHEILNSISPIRLTAAGMLQMLRRDEVPVNPADIDDEMVKDFISGLEAIRKRSSNLSDFIEGFRKIVKIPPPNPTLFQVKTFISNIVGLFQNDQNAGNITFQFVIKDENLVMMADERQVAQVLINLIKNAMESIAERHRGIIDISAEKTHGQLIIRVADNGTGIEKELLDNVFTPFFSTKEGGSGIGLSISRQIMKMHKGDLLINSEVGKGTSVLMRFPL